MTGRARQPARAHAVPAWTANYFVVAVRAVVCIEDWGTNTCKRGYWKDNPNT